MDRNLKSWRRRVGGPLLVVLLAPAAALLGAPPASALSAPTGLVATSAASGPNTPTFGWTRVSGAAKYQLQVDNDPGFGTPELNALTTNNRFVADKVLPTGDLYWRVSALPTSGTASAWSASTLSSETVGVPSPQSPVGGTLQPPQDVPVLTWSAVGGAASYTVQVDETDDFITPLVSVQTKVTSYAAGPLAKGSYFWRVRATRATGVESAFSAPVGFGVDELPAVTVVSPTDDPSFEVDDVVLDWQPVAGAAYYQLQVSTDTGFNTLVDPKSANVDATTKVYGTRYSPPVTYDNNQYYWRVRAVDTDGHPAPWSQIQAQFKRVWKDQIQPVYPLGLEANGPTHIDGDPYFQWTPVPHATEYELQLGLDPDFSPGTYSACRVAGTTYTPNQFQINHDSSVTTLQDGDDCQIGPGTVYFWRVRPLDRPFTNPGVEGLYTPTQTFIWDDQVIPDSSHMSPVGGATVAIPTLTWTPLRDAVSYKVTIKNRTGGTVKSAVTTYATSYTPPLTTALKAADGPFTWSVQAVTAGGTPSILVHNGSFNITTPFPDTAAAPLAAIDGADPSAPTTRAPALRWEPHPGAAYYRVHVGSHGTGIWFLGTSADVFEKNTVYPAITDTGTRLMSTGYYDWMVDAYDASDNYLGSSAVNTFRIKQLDAATGQQIALNGTTLDAGLGCDDRLGEVAVPCPGVPATPVFDWEPVDGAGMYIVYVSEDEDFTNLTENLTKLGATANTRYTPTWAALKEALPDSQAGASYYWYIRPCKTPTLCAASPVSTGLGVANSFRKQSPAVVLGAPAHNTDAATTDVASPEVTFTWQDYRVTNAAATWAATGEKANQSAMQYRIQVDNDSTFITPLDSIEVDQPTYTAFSKMYPDGELFWRVQAIDAEGNGLTWSATREFTKKGPAPTPTSPTEGASVNGVPTFSWGAQPFAGGYELEVYKNNDTAASQTNRVVSASTKQPAYVPTSPLPASSSSYVWRVRRVDGTPNKNPGAWSAWRSFSSGGSAPTLVAPTTGSWQPGNGVLLDWSPVPGATSYRVEGTGNGRSLSGTPKTTPATAWAPTSTVGDGTWTWWVTALDAAGAPLGTSGSRTFKVDGTVPTLVSLTPTSPSAASSFTATFSEPVKNVTKSTFKIKKYGSSTVLSAAVTVSSDRKRAVLNPTYNLKSGATYVISLTSWITDDRGNRLVTTSRTVRIS